MNRYELTATTAERVCVARFADYDDTEAHYTALRKVLDKAHRFETWARGEIVLRNTTTGQVIATMEGK